MKQKKILLLHISSVSGHRSASFAIEKALRELDQGLQIRSVNGFNYTSPLAEVIFNRLYMFVISVVPQFWDYLYDNKNVAKRLERSKALLHKVKNRKIKKLFAEFEPDAIVCTQAFPCGLVADYKRRHNLKLPLIGVLTDYAPHSYW
ncbi:MAG: hypothetical protein HQ595_02860, partial [Candidatus Omnitrophica bacterium]|nr:hypothetical protein [Candidatus Omnitrophota bacterium]